MCWGETLSVAWGETLSGCGYLHLSTARHLLPTRLPVCLHCCLRCTALQASPASSTRTLPLRSDASWKDCMIEADKIQILRRRDGKPWVLGGGAFGQASARCLAVRVAWLRIA